MDTKTVWVFTSNGLRVLTVALSRDVPLILCVRRADVKDDRG